MRAQPYSHVTHSGQNLYFWSRTALLDCWESEKNLKLIADGCRLNILSSIQHAGSGHIGTSFSSIDIMLAARFFLDPEGFASPRMSQQGLFFSSKGHDAPALYTTMHFCGELEDEDLLTLRRLGGLPGHPETITPGVPTNTGSLGMGISKAKGFVKAQRIKNPSSRDTVVVLLGDGELNEGQIWESMPGAARDGYSELVAIVDANGIQSDTWISKTLPNGNVQQRVEGCGWGFLECEGNDPADVIRALEESRTKKLPTLIYARTTKGSGIPWMEDFPADGDYYKFHSGAISPEQYSAAADTLVPKFSGTNPAAPTPPLPDKFDSEPYSPRARAESLLTSWERKLPGLMTNNERIVIMDGDLSYDTGTHLARTIFPDRYVQSGIAEQDMVSMAGPQALSGHIPIVHSFATFLTMRATEQIFNNATEMTPIIYLGFLAGLVPSAPGFSHQAVTDVGIMASIPGMRVFEPSSSAELDWTLEQCLEYQGPSYIRIGGLAPVPDEPRTTGSPNLIEILPGSGAALIVSGPLLTHSSLDAAAKLRDFGHNVAVFTRSEITAPFSTEEIARLSDFQHLVVIENHNPSQAKLLHLSAGLGAISGAHMHRIGLVGIPKNGQAEEVLSAHGLDGASVAESINKIIGAIEPD